MKEYTKINIQTTLNFDEIKEYSYNLEKYIFEVIDKSIIIYEKNSLPILLKVVAIFPAENTILTLI
jgi:hypothetical protein